MSRIAADVSMPSSVLIGLRLTSTGNSRPSLWRAKSSSPAPIAPELGVRGEALAVRDVRRRGSRSGSSISTCWPISSSRL